MLLSDSNLVDDYRTFVEAWFRARALRDGIVLPDKLEDGGARKRRIKFSTNGKLNDKSGWYEFSILPDLSVYARVKDYRTGIYGCYPF